MGVSPMKRLRNKNPEIPGPADENVGHSRAGRPCHLQPSPFLLDGGLPCIFPIERQPHNSPDNEEFLVIPSPGFPFPVENPGLDAYTALPEKEWGFPTRIPTIKQYRLRRKRMLFFRKLICPGKAFTMSLRKLSACVFLSLLLVNLTVFSSAQDNPNPPTTPVRLIFIHHSTGQNWLDDGNGGLGVTLRDNHYFVSDTNYGWGPGSIGDRTDIGNWWEWFRGPNAATYTATLYAESEKHSEYSRLDTNPDPSGENQVILFKSCFPNSALQGNVSDPIPSIESNPLKGESCGSDAHTVSNAKGIYMDLLPYFSLHPEKLFIVVAAPPLGDATYAANARAFNEWLVNDWLDGYAQKNVFVFDFYNVLTTNGGSATTNDLGRETGNHHRWWNGAVQHKSDVAKNTLAYPSSGGDDHPSRAGNLKASAEFVQLLNVAYHRWKDAPPAPSTKPVWKIY